MGIGRRAFATDSSDRGRGTLTRFEARVLRKIPEFGLIAAVVLAVGGFGGTEPVSWGISQALILLSGLLLVAFSRGGQMRHYRKLLWFPLALGVWIATATVPHGQHE